MKPLKLTLRIWLAVTSVVSFLAGWVLFAHAGKPAPLFSSQAGQSEPVSAPVQMPTLEPVPSLDSLVNNGAQPLQAAPSFTIMRSSPRLRAMGS